MEASSRNFLNTQLLPVRKSPVAGPASAFLISVAGLLRLTQDAITTNKPTSQYNPRTVSRCASFHWKSVRSKHSTTLQEVTGHGGSSHQCIKRNQLYGSSQRSVLFHVYIVSVSPRSTKHDISSTQKIIWCKRGRTTRQPTCCIVQETISLQPPHRIALCCDVL